MAISLNSSGKARANSLISSGKVNKTADWSFSAADGDKLLGSGNDWAAYGAAHLGVDTAATDNTKAKYEYPFEKGGTIYRSALTAIRQRASQNGATAIFNAAGDLLEKIDGKSSSQIRRALRAADLPAYDPDGDGDNDAVEAVGYLQSIRTLVDEALGCLGAPVGDDDNDGAVTDLGQRRIAARAHPEQPADRVANFRCEAKPSTNSADVYLYDIIGSGFFGGISADSFKSELKALGSVKQINVHINSDGGDVFEGKAIYTQLAQHPAKVVVYVDGLAASIASLIAMAGDEIQMAEGAFMMVHKAWGVAVGNDDEMMKTAKLLRTVTDTIIDTYASRTGDKCSRDEIAQLVGDETWLTAKDAVDKGFADKMAAPVRAAAAAVRDICGLDGSVIPAVARFKNTPRQLLPTPNRLKAQKILENLDKKLANTAA